MASITNLKLKLIKHDHSKKTAKIKVSYKVHLSCVEKRMKCLKFIENIELWGEDSPDPDDFLFRFPTGAFNVEADGLVSRSRTVTIGEEILDEDGFPRPTDEVYAKVRISPLLPKGHSAKSNTIEHRF